MSVIRIASRYAKPLVELAEEQGKLEVVLGNIKVLQDAIKNRDLAMMLKSPIVNGGKKKQVLTALFGEGFDDLTNKFLSLVVDKGREAALPAIADEFVAQYRQLKKITTAKVTSAKPLSEAALEKIKAKLLSSSMTRENIEIVTAVNPDLLGGFVIEIGDKLYDSSVAHKLNLLRKEFVGNDYKKA